MVWRERKLNIVSLLLRLIFWCCLRCGNRSRWALDAFRHHKESFPFQSGLLPLLHQTPETYFSSQVVLCSHPALLSGECALTDSLDLHVGKWRQKQEDTCLISHSQWAVRWWRGGVSSLTLPLTSSTVFPAPLCMPGLCMECCADLGVLSWESVKNDCSLTSSQAESWPLGPLVFCFCYKPDKSKCGNFQTPILPSHHS